MRGYFSAATSCDPWVSVLAVKCTQWLTIHIYRIVFVYTQWTGFLRKVRSAEYYENIAFMHIVHCIRLRMRWCKDKIQTIQAELRGLIIRTITTKTTTAIRNSRNKCETFVLSTAIVIATIWKCIADRLLCKRIILWPFPHLPHPVFMWACFFVLHRWVFSHEERMATSMYYGFKCIFYRLRLCLSSFASRRMLTHLFLLQIP